MFWVSNKSRFDENGVDHTRRSQNVERLSQVIVPEQLVFFSVQKRLEGEELLFVRLPAICRLACEIYGRREKEIRIVEEAAAG